TPRDSTKQGGDRPDTRKCAPSRTRKRRAGNRLPTGRAPEQRSRCLLPWSRSANPQQQAAAASAKVQFHLIRRGVRKGGSKDPPTHPPTGPPPVTGRGSGNRGREETCSYRLAESRLRQKSDGLRSRDSSIGQSRRLESTGTVVHLRLHTRGGGGGGEEEGDGEAGGGV
ncbi:hypothetical protein PVAP13_9NG144773, partial [Panicum virgatum]